jgi:hypothetical protein
MILTKPRVRLAGLAMLGIAAIGATGTGTASAAPSPATAQTSMQAPGTDDTALAKKGKCRWVKRIGVVCETELGTITL